MTPQAITTRLRIINARVLKAQTTGKWAECIERLGKA